MSLLKKLYDKTMSFSSHPKAVWFLGFISFIESSFFPLPADILFLPMVLAKPKNAYRLAFIATVTSILGSIFGYYIGYYGYETIAKPFLDHIGKLQTFEEYREWIKGDLYLLWGLLLSSGFSHLPPIKVVTILSGVAHIPLGFFLISSLIGRGLRFYLLAFLLYKYGDSIKDFIEKRLTVLSIAVCLIGFIIYMGFKWIH